MNETPKQQVPGVYHRRVGDIFVTALHDGFQDVSMTTVRDIAEAEASQMLRNAMRPVPRRTSVNCFLIRAPSHTTLVDTGYGPGVHSTVGFLAANLASAGVEPADISTVLLTHMHPDHWGGLTDKQGTMLFRQAELAMSETEWAYWHDDDAMLKVDDPKHQKLFCDARRHVAPYRNRLRTFREGEVAPGVTAVPLPGHTPGHTGYLIESKGTSLLVWGDIVHVQELQVARPEVTIAADVDPAQAVATRRTILDRVATERLGIAGMHLHFPAFAHVVREGADYRLLPEAWSMDLAGDAPA